MLLKEALSLVLDTLGLPPCDDIFKARKMIRDQVKRDGSVKKYIEEVIKLAYNIAKGRGDEYAS